MTKWIAYASALSALMMQTTLLPNTASAQPRPPDCRYETGIIKPGNTPDSIAAGALKGPFLVTMLQSDVDPAAPKRAYLIWTKDNRWFAADDFKGQFYLGNGDMLAGRNDYTTRGVFYSGCRL